MNTKQNTALWCGILLILPLSIFAENPTGTVSVATAVELKDIGRNPSKAYVVVSYPTTVRGVMRVQLAKGNPPVTRIGVGGREALQDSCLYPVFQQLFETKIVIETDPGHYGLWVGVPTARIPTPDYHYFRFDLKAGQQFIWGRTYGKK